MTGLTWRKSSRSGNGNGNCVEVAEVPGAMAVRDSKDPAGDRLTVSSAGWRSFVAELKAGRLS
ncbi:MAG TPA: DUF397 domain-containing protein [Actinocatenispora sp.]